jgi:hypothetical protein
VATRESPTSPASSASPSPSGGLSSPTPTANAAALAECPDGREFDVGKRRVRRASGTNVRFGRSRRHSRLANWLVTRLVTPSVATPRSAPRRAAGVPLVASAAAMANHSLEWSAVRVRYGIAVSSSGVGDSATASNTSRSSVPRPPVICRMPCPCSKRRLAINQR